MPDVPGFGGSDPAAHPFSIARCGRAPARRLRAARRAAARARRPLARRPDRGARRRAGARARRGRRARLHDRALAGARLAPLRAAARHAHGRCAIPVPGRTCSRRTPALRSIVFMRDARASGRARPIHDAHARRRRVARPPARRLARGVARLRPARQPARAPAAARRGLGRARPRRCRSSTRSSCNGCGPTRRARSCRGAGTFRWSSARTRSPTHSATCCPTAGKRPVAGRLLPMSLPLRAAAGARSISRAPRSRAASCGLRRSAPDGFELGLRRPRRARRRRCRARPVPARTPIRAGTPRSCAARRRRLARARRGRGRRARHCSPWSGARARSRSPGGATSSRATTSCAGRLEQRVAQVSARHARRRSTPATPTRPSGCTRGRSSSARCSPAGSPRSGAHDRRARRPRRRRSSRASGC